MKILKSLIALFTISMVLGLTVSAQAQSSQLPGEPVIESPELHSRITQQPLSVGTKTIQNSAVDPVLHAQVAQLTKATEQALSTISFERLAATQSREESKSTVKTNAGVSIIDDHNVNVKVAYESRPIGGILTVQVSLTPSFRGIGVSTRPVVSRSVAQAVDEMDEAIVRRMVSELTKEIHEEFAAHDTAQ